MFGLLRKWKRKKIAALPFPEHWEQILHERFPPYQQLPEELRQRFRYFLHVFALEKDFTGVAGMEITDEVRVVVSACAVRLILHLDLSYFDRVSEILIYPYVYRHPDGEDMVLGEVSDWGTVVLSWPAVLQGLEHPRDAHDAAIHEFAHALDRGGDGQFDGTPRLPSMADYGPWAQIMSLHYLRLREGGKPERRILDMYGATNEAEFFAVATETYFEKPRQMKRLLPDLYEELQSFYGGDPAEDFTSKN
jgi:Mlc titration factor MtfA (ptsG expression regulator)